ncbi:MAG: peptide chain release factor N(5)-glutamine methyltransferase [Pirellulaceae bacterium]|nr:peptide chain release factor N(5)-glutamine methyltransferase [Pirellulaceae bacterium]
MSTAEAWTVGRLLTWTAEYLKKYGSTSPRLDAEVLLAEARHCARIDLYTAFAEEPSEEVRASFKEMVRRRAEGAPVAYLVGRKEFYSLSFEVNPDVLIPRPETEHLVVDAIDRAKQLTGQAPNSTQTAPTATAATQPTARVHETPNQPKNQPKSQPTSQSTGLSANNSAGEPASDSASDSVNPAAGGAGQGEDEIWRPKPVKSYAGLTIADVGTGSGSVAISLAKSLSGAKIMALDLSQPALALAARNVQKHAVENQVTLLASDLLSAVDSMTFDIIASNPPYVTEAEYAELPASVKNYEPKSALVSGPTGTEIIERLMPQSAARLRRGGWLLMEISPMIADKVVALVDRRMWAEPIITKDLSGHARIVSVCRL